MIPFVEKSGARRRAGAAENDMEVDSNRAVAGSEALFQPLPGVRRQFRSGAGD